jgi:hypothetical protein
MLFFKINMLCYYTKLHNPKLKKLPKQLLVRPLNYYLVVFITTSYINGEDNCVDGSPSDSIPSEC